MQCTGQSLLSTLCWKPVPPLPVPHPPAGLQGCLSGSRMKFTNKKRIAPPRHQAPGSLAHGHDSAGTGQCQAGLMSDQKEVTLQLAEGWFTPLPLFLEATGFGPTAPIFRGTAPLHCLLGGQAVVHSVPSISEQQVPLVTERVVVFFVMGNSPSQTTLWGSEHCP